LENGGSGNVIIRRGLEVGSLDSTSTRSRHALLGFLLILKKLYQFCTTELTGSGAQNGFVQGILPSLHPRIVVFLGDFDALMAE
jgi:hypothetical protein